MAQTKTFTLLQAKELLPQLRQLLNAANDELEEIEARIEELNTEQCNAELRFVVSKTSQQTSVSELDQLRQARDRLNAASNELSSAQQDYLHCLNTWVERISETGVILRDLKSGLLDFPARQGDFHYLLCWRLSDEDITHWHLFNDGFIGRKPLAVLTEYF